jgi:hypothetical protein
VQRATAQSKIGICRGCGVAKAPLVSQAGWSHSMYFSLSFFVSHAHLEFSRNFFTYEDDLELTAKN